MTCIVAYKKDGDVYMGCDSAAVSSDYGMKIINNPKVFIKDEFIIGYTSSFRMGQLLQYKLDVPEYTENKSVIGYMCTDFID